MDIKINMDDLAKVLSPTTVSSDLLITACVESYRLTPDNINSYITGAMIKIYADLSYQVGVDISNASKIGELVDEDKLLKELINAHSVITSILLNTFNGILNTAVFSKYDYGVAVFDAR